MQERAEITDWQMMGLVVLVVVAMPVICLGLGAKFVIAWLKFRWSER